VIYFEAKAQTLRRAVSKYLFWYALNAIVHLNVQTNVFFTSLRIIINYSHFIESLKKELLSYIFPFFLMNL